MGYAMRAMRPAVFAPMLVVLVGAAAASGCTTIHPPHDPAQLTYKSLDACTIPKNGSTATRVEGQVTSKQSQAERIRSLMCNPDAQDARQALSGVDLDDAITLAFCFGGKHNWCDDPGTVAEATFIAADLDMQRVQAQVEELDIPPILKRHFLARVRATEDRADKELIEYTEAQRRMYVAPIEAARKMWLEEAARNAPFDKRAKAAAPRVEAALSAPPTKARDLPGTRAELAGIRDEAVRACIGAGHELGHCVGSAPAYGLTAQLVQLAIKAKDEAGASAELAMYENASPRENREELIRAFSKRARDVEYFNRISYLEAKSKGVSDVELTERFGPVPLAVNDATPVHAGNKPKLDTSLHDAVAVLRTQQGKTELVARRVSRVDVNSKDVVLSFETMPGTYPLATGCRANDTPVSMNADGYIVYQQQCAAIGTGSDSTPVAPLTVPSAEGAGLRPGMFVEAVSDKKTHRGFVLAAYGSGAQGRGEGPVIKVRAFVTFAGTGL